ncbi:hypothetical protein [Pseudomonas sp. EA_15y_Pfl2_R67]|uniref:hypothetical protein n=1 Tax=Pseudomonas sp. EA_15y_Pfl2_R67 TaxID=3088687 RepID=UPI0030DAF75E
MATDITATGDSKRATAPLEIYQRAANGQYLPRLALADHLLKSVNVAVTNIQVNVERPTDLAPVFGALRALPQHLQHKGLLKSYRAVLNHYENYLHHGGELYLDDVLKRCATEVPEFESALEEVLEGMALPGPFDFEFEANCLKPLISLCNSYLAMLAYNFHAVTIRHPNTAATEEIIEGFIERAIDLLKKELGGTLMPGGEIQDSLYLEAFHELDTDRFERYLTYDGKSDSSQNIRKFVALANRNNKRDDEVRLAKPRVNSNVRLLADTLIDLIERFEALLAAKKNFAPQADGELGFPIET